MNYLSIDVRFFHCERIGRFGKLVLPTRLTTTTSNNLPELRTQTLTGFVVVLILAGAAVGYFVGSIKQQIFDAWGQELIKYFEVS